MTSVTTAAGAADDLAAHAVDDQRGAVDEHDAPPAREKRPLLVFVLIAALIGLRALALIGAMPDDSSRGVPAIRGDAKRYHQIATETGTAYRDFEVEYPPVTLGLIEVINGNDIRSTLRRLGVVAFALDMLALGAVAYGWGRKAALGYLVIGLPFLFLPFTYFRIDLLSVALAMWGLALARRNRQVAGGVLLALAVFAKLWPLAVLPALIAAGRTRALVTSVVTGFAGAVAWFVLGGTAGFEQVLTFRGARGWQMESVGGGIVRAFSNEAPRTESGALRFGDVPLAVTAGLAIVMLSLVVWIWFRVAIGTKDEAIIYGVAPLVATTAFMVCSPLLSPQFLIWLTPFAAICWVSGQRALAWLAGWAVVLTMVLTQAYTELVRGELSGHVALLVRNGTLVALLVVGLMVIARSTRREPSSIAATAI